jgi:hypothetical protein
MAYGEAAVFSWMAGSIPPVKIGKAVTAGLVPAVHAAPPQISRRSDSRPFMAYGEAVVFSWMAGSSPAMTEKRNPGLHPQPMPQGLKSLCEKLNLC